MKKTLSLLLLLSVALPASAEDAKTEQLNELSGASKPETKNKSEDTDNQKSAGEQEIQVKISENSVKPVVEKLQSGLFAAPTSEEQKACDAARAEQIQSYARSVAEKVVNEDVTLQTVLTDLYGSHVAVKERKQLVNDILTVLYDVNAELTAVAKEDASKLGVRAKINALCHQIESDTEGTLLNSVPENSVSQFVAQSPQTAAAVVAGASALLVSAGYGIAKLV